jgi:hypothetical protein
MLHADVAALLPEMREHLAKLSPYERPISLDNWAAMVDRSYSEMRVALQYLDKPFLRAYIDHRHNYYKMFEAELRALPDYIIKYMRPLMDKYGLTLKDTQRIRRRLGLNCSPKHSRNTQHALKFIKVGMTLMDIAAAADMTLDQVQGLVSRGHLEPFIELGYEKRLCRNNCMQRVRVVTKIKGTEKSRDRSKSRR